MQDFETTLNSFITKCQGIVDKHFEERRFNWKSIVEIAGGRKFVKAILRDEGQSYGGVFCYVAREDGYTKQLGSYKAGDIFKPAGPRPAKTVRGNIFNEDNGMGMIGPYGPAYLR